MTNREGTLYCPRCGEKMVYDPMDFWKCPRCGGEFWDDEEKLAEVQAQELAFAARGELREQLKWSLGKRYTEVLPLEPVIDWRSRGSRKSGRKRKKPVFKPISTQRYMLM